MYNVQCISEGHVFTAPPGSDLEDRCIANAEKGRLDALILGPDECPMCLDGEREELNRTMDLCGLAGCMFMDDRCESSGCVVARELDELDSGIALTDMWDGPDYSEGYSVEGVMLNGAQLFERDLRLGELSF